MNYLYRQISGDKWGIFEYGNPDPLFTGDSWSISRLCKRLNSGEETVEEVEKILARR